MNRDLIVESSYPMPEMLDTRYEIGRESILVAPVAAAALEELDELLQAKGDDEADADGDEVNEHDGSLDADYECMRGAKAKALNAKGAKVERKVSRRVRG